MEDSTVALRLEDVCFVHWPVPPDALAAQVPAGETVATRDGRAWLSVVGTAVRPRFLPDRFGFAELNVRTYLGGEPPSVHFLDVVVDDPLAAGGASLLWDVPARFGRVAVERDGDGLVVRSDGRGAGGFEARLVPEGDLAPAPDGSLARWLLERYRFVRDDGSSATVDHEPWRVRAATGEVLADDLPAGLPEPAGEPTFHYSPGTLVWV